ncbi:DnaB-like replicative helicase [Vibrio phage D528]|nr:hypothetical protein MYOV002v2_p0168 [Vibrio phage 144E46.1]
MLEQLVINHLVTNEPYLRKVQPYLRSDYFKTEGEKVVFGLIDEFVNEFNAPPTVDALAVSLDKMKLAEGIFDQAVDVLEGIEPGLETQEWLVKETEAWARDSAVHNAIRRSLSIYNGNDPEMERSNIPNLLQDALDISFDTDIGHVYWEMAAQQYDYMHAEETKFPFNTEIMNQVTRGGIPNKTLNVVMMGINLGKTTWLIDRAAEWIEGGKNVLYVSCEVAEEVIRHRTDVRLMDKTFDQVEAMTKPEYLANIDKLREKTTGQLFIKEFASGAVHAGHIRAHVREIEAKEDIKIDMICVDYIGEMCSYRLPLHMMGNTNTYYGSIARELRALAIELDLPIWSAVQTTRDAQGDSDNGMDKVADAISIPKICDFMISFSQDEVMEQMDQARGYVMKNRYANKAKLRSIAIGLDNDRQKFYDVDISASPNMSDEEKAYASSVKVKNGNDNTENVNNWKF